MGIWRKQFKHYGNFFVCFAVGLFFFCKAFACIGCIYDFMLCPLEVVFVYSIRYIVLQAEIVNYVAIANLSGTSVASSM